MYHQPIPRFWLRRFTADIRYMPDPLRKYLRHLPRPHTAVAFFQNRQHVLVRHRAVLHPHPPGKFRKDIVNRGLDLPAFFFIFRQLPDCLDTYGCKIFFQKLLL